MAHFTHTWRVRGCASLLCADGERAETPVHLSWIVDRMVLSDVTECKTSNRKRTDLALENSSRYMDHGAYQLPLTSCDSATRKPVAAQ